MEKHDYEATKEMSRIRSATAEGDVVFYQVTTKFVDSENSVPEESKEVLYYTLSIGHHTGVIDCLEEKLRIPKAEFQEICDSLERDAKYKLEGAIRNTEIQIEKQNLPLLIEGLQRALNDKNEALEPKTKLNIEAILQLFETLQEDTAAYIMARLRF